MLSAVTLLFSSCLGDGDTTYPITGVGTITNSFSSEMVMDYGIKVSMVGINTSAIDNGDRIFFYGTIVDETYEGQALNPGEQITASLIQAFPLYDVTVINSSDALGNDVQFTDYDEFDWFDGGGYGNGYMNFQMTMQYIIKEGSGNTANTLMEPKTYAIFKNIDTSAKTADIIIAVDNRKSEFLQSDSNSELSDGYNWSRGNLPVTLNASQLYYDFSNAGLTDEDNITVTFYKQYHDEDGVVQTEELNVPYTTIQLGYLKRQYGSLY